MGRAGPGPVDKSEGLGGRAGPGPVDKVRGWGPGWPANRSEGFWGYGPRAGRPTLFGKPIQQREVNMYQALANAHKITHTYTHTDTDADTDTDTYTDRV